MFKYIDKRHYGPYNHQVLYQLAKANETLLQRMSMLHALDVHTGCVNSVIWDDSGEILLSGSDDQNLVINKPWSDSPPFKLQTAHKANIFSAKFIPYSSNHQIISCSGDGMLLFTDLDKIPETHNCKFNCHRGTAYDVITVASDPHSFFSCGEDGTVRWFDLRVKTSCSVGECKEDILLNMHRAVTALTVNPMAHYQLAVATQDSCVHIYDRRMLGTKAHDSYLDESSKAVIMKLKPDGLEGKSHRITSLKYNSLGKEILASYSSDYLYLFDTQNFKETHVEEPLEDDSDHGSPYGPTLKRLRLRGDWSDTGPQAVPECELRNQAEDVGQARPTLHSTLMQRMTDILSRMLHNSPSPPRRREHPRAPSWAPPMEEEGMLPGMLSISSDGTISTDPMQERESTSSSAPPSIASPASVPTDPPLFIDHYTSSVGASLQDTLPQPPAYVPHPRSSTLSASETENISGGDMSVENSPPGETLPSQSTGTCSVMNAPSTSQTETVSDIIKDSTAPSLDSYIDADLNETPKQRGSRSNSIPGISCDTNDVCASNLSLIHPPDVKPDEKVSACDNRISDSSNKCVIESSETRDASSESAAPTLSTTTENIEDLDELMPEDPSALDLPACSSFEEPSHGCGSSSISDRKSPKRMSPSSDDPQDDLSCNRTRTGAKTKMARAINKVVQRVRSEKISESINNPIPLASVLMQFKGHRNARTMIKEACFWGDDHVMSGSDCGRIFVWEKATGKLVMLWEADRHVVNCVQPHPSLPILASSGIDYDVKLWAPTLEEPTFDEKFANDVSKRNEMLLAETRDTVTVPATFMIRMLASLNQIRQNRLRSRLNEDDEVESDDNSD